MMRPLNVDKFLSGLDLKSKWRKMAKMQEFPLSVPRHAIHITRVLTEICEETLGRLASFARSEARKRQPKSLEDWRSLSSDVRRRCEDREHRLVHWKSMVAILAGIESLCYGSQIAMASKRSAVDAMTTEAYKHVRMCVWILYLRLLAVKEFLEWFVPIGRLTAPEALGEAELNCFPDLLVSSRDTPILSYRQSDLINAIRALSIRWRANLFYFPGLDRYLGALKARFVLLTCFPYSTCTTTTTTTTTTTAAASPTLDRPDLFQERQDGRRGANIAFLTKVMELFVPMERDLLLHKELMENRARTCLQSGVWTNTRLRGQVRGIVTQWMLGFTGAARGAFLAKRFRKSILDSMVRVGEINTFLRRFPNFECNSRNVISKLRPNDSRKYDKQFTMPSLLDVIETTLAPYTGDMDPTTFDWSDAEEQDRDTPPDYMAARRTLLIHCLDQLFQETNQSLRFAPFLIRNLHEKAYESESDAIADVLHRAETENRILIIQTLSGFSVWNPSAASLKVAGDLPSALVEWAVEIMRFWRGRIGRAEEARERSGDPRTVAAGDDEERMLETLLLQEGGDTATTTTPVTSGDLSRILEALGLKQIVLNLM